MQDMIDGIDIPDQVVPQVIETTIIKEVKSEATTPKPKYVPQAKVKEYDGVVLTMTMVDRWDTIGEKLEAAQKQIDELEKRMMKQEKKKTPPTVVQ